MKSIHYDAEGDILSVTFADAIDNRQTGVELSDNIVLYFDPINEQPLHLILISYRAMLQASAKAPILLDGFQQMPAKMQRIIARLLNRAPLIAFLQLDDTSPSSHPASRLHEVFALSALQMVASD